MKNKKNFKIFRYFPEKCIGRKSIYFIIVTDEKMKNSLKVSKKTKIYRLKFKN